MLLVLRVGFVVLVVTASTVLVGCGSSGDRTGTIGTSEVTVQEDADTPFEVMRSLLASTPYLPWARNCFIGQIESKLSPEEAEELVGEGKSALDNFLFAQTAEVEEACFGSGRRVFKQDASEEELQLLRSSEVVGLEMLLKRIGIPSDVRKCMTAKVGATPPEALIRFAEGSESQRVDFLEEVAAECGYTG